VIQDHKDERETMVFQVKRVDLVTAVEKVKL
jgi:hypothetical protein